VQTSDMEKESPLIGGDECEVVGIDFHLRDFSLEQYLLCQRTVLPPLKEDMLIRESEISAPKHLTGTRYPRSRLASFLEGHADREIRSPPVW